MERYSSLSPGQCLDRAETFALGQNASLKERTDESATFTAHVAPSCGEWIAMTIITVITFGLGLLWAAVRIGMVFLFPSEGRLIVRPVGDGRTRLLVDGRGPLREQLDTWVSEELVANEQDAGARRRVGRRLPHPDDDPGQPR